MNSRTNVLAAAIVVAAITLPFAMEALFAPGARSCGVSASAGCYPWGSEGPAGGHWRYGSKAAYIAGGVIPFLLAACAVAAAASSKDTPLPRGRAWTVAGLSAASLLALIV